MHPTYDAGLRTVTRFTSDRPLRNQLHRFHQAGYPDEPSARKSANALGARNFEVKLAVIEYGRPMRSPYPWAEKAEPSK